MCKKITGKHYKKVALVHLGDPPADFAREQQKKFQVIQQKTLDMNVQTERTKLNKERADKRVEAQKKYHHAKSAWDEKKNKDPEFDEPEPDQPMLEEDVPVDEAIPDRIAELDPNVKLITARVAIMCGETGEKALMKKVEDLLPNEKRLESLGAAMQNAEKLKSSPLY